MKNDEKRGLYQIIGVNQAILYKNFLLFFKLFRHAPCQNFV